MADSLEENFVLENDSQGGIAFDGAELEGELVASDFEGSDDQGVIIDGSVGAVFDEDADNAKPTSSLKENIAQDVDDESKYEGMSAAQRAFEKRMNMLRKRDLDAMQSSDDKKEQGPKAKNEKQQPKPKVKRPRNKDIIESLAEHEIIPDVVALGDSMEEVLKSSVTIEVFDNKKSKKLVNIDLEAIVITPSAERSIQIIKDLREKIIPGRVQNKDRVKSLSRIIKLWSRHMKAPEQQEIIKKRESLFGVGTPNRIEKLFEMKAFDICKRLKYVIFDMSYMDAKERKMLDVPEVEIDLWKVMDRIVKSRTAQTEESSDATMNVLKNAKIIII